MYVSFSSDGTWVIPRSPCRREKAKTRGHGKHFKPPAYLPTVPILTQEKVGKGSNFTTCLYFCKNLSAVHGSSSTSINLLFRGSKPYFVFHCENDILCNLLYWLNKWMNIDKWMIIVMYRKFRNVPIFEDFSPICTYFLGFRVGKYAPAITLFYPNSICVCSIVLTQAPTDILYHFNHWYLCKVSG